LSGGFSCGQYDYSRVFRTIQLLGIVGSFYKSCKSVVHMGGGFPTLLIKINAIFLKALKKIVKRTQ